jgi:hypothetical protein
VSCASARDNDTDLPLIVRALGDRGIVAEITDWDDLRTDWGRFAAAIVRSPWDYHRRYAEFLAWVGRVSQETVLHNAAEVIRWNTDKTYIAGSMRRASPSSPPRTCAARRTWCSRTTSSRATSS